MEEFQVTKLTFHKGRTSVEWNEEKEEHRVGSPNPPDKTLPQVFADVAPLVADLCEVPNCTVTGIIWKRDKKDGVIFVCQRSLLIFGSPLCWNTPYLPASLHSEEMTKVLAAAEGEAERFANGDRLQRDMLHEAA